jgi:hypothetical protein
MNISLRDAVIGGATLALLLYAAMTAARSMADAMRPSAPTVACNSATVHCGAALEVARGDN